MSNKIGAIFEWGNLLSLLSFVGMVTFWGGRLQGRVKAMENRQCLLEERMTRIEEKIDELGIKTTDRIDLWGSQTTVRLDTIMHALIGK